MKAILLRILAYKIFIIHNFNAEKNVSEGLRRENFGPVKCSSVNLRVQLKSVES